MTDGRVAGFTGTQVGCTDAQGWALLGLLDRLGIRRLRHGDCIGADALAHVYALRLEAWISLHPPTNGSKRARCDEALVGFGHEVLPAKPYLDRNHDIVDASDFLVACPKDEDGGPYDEANRRSGTWATVRYALKRGKRVYLVRPSGRIDTLDPA